jgi:hypothetical protein
MGYSTEFVGKVRIEPPLNGGEVAYLRKFAGTRRMRMKEGPYFVGQGGLAGQDDGPNVIAYDEPPEGQPGLWCQWEPLDDGTALEWNGGEKFYDADEWMRYLIEHFLRRGARAAATKDPQLAVFTFDHVASGRIMASGEEWPDLWRIDVAANQVSVERYDVGDDGLDEEQLEEGHPVANALFGFAQNPAEAMNGLREYLDALPDRRLDRELARFLRDVATVLPRGSAAELVDMVDGGAPVSGSRR